jgi:hypothetical protein
MSSVAHVGFVWTTGPVGPNASAGAGKPNRRNARAPPKNEQRDDGKQQQINPSRRQFFDLIGHLP